jgi:hypothetical protein
MNCEKQMPRLPPSSLDRKRNHARCAHVFTREGTPLPIQKALRGRPIFTVFGEKTRNRVSREYYLSPGKFEVVTGLSAPQNARYALNRGFDPLLDLDQNRAAGHDFYRNPFRPHGNRSELPLPFARLFDFRPTERGSADAFEAVSVRGLLESTLCLCQEKFKHRGIEVTMDIEPPNLVMHCQQVQFSQVLLNLFSNACDAIEKLPEKWLRISVRQTPEGITRFEITNSGKGVPQAVQEKMFNPFFTTKEIGKGTGLGLSISQGIIKAHGGKLYLNSACPNTRLVIDLPRQEKKNAQNVA